MIRPKSNESLHPPERVTDMSILSKIAEKSRPPFDTDGAGDMREIDRLTAGLIIACPDPTHEDRARDAHRLQGQYLARQDMWEKLSAELLQADKTRLATPGAMPVSELLSYGARSDVVMAAEHALFDGEPAKDAPVLEGIEGLEEMLAESDVDPMCAIVVAQAHMDIGWAWRGTGKSDRLRARNREAFEAHFDRAGDILDSIEDSCINSPFYHTAKCALNGGGLNPQHRIARDYERLIDLNPKNPSPMRALGTYLSPRWFGSHQELELEARRTAARTQAVWGAGGYTWVMFDVLATDEGACENLDLEFFVEGLQDILTCSAEQQTANLLAAYCAYIHQEHLTTTEAALHTRRRISACADWIVRNHMTELHPLIWAHAAAGFANNVKISSPRRFAAMGQRDGLRVIAQLFHRDIKNGHRIIFTADGPVAELS